MPKIESLIRRAGGSKVTLKAPDREYHFKPDGDDARHIADVDVAHHAKTLLRIKEGYRAVDEEDALEDDKDNKDDLGDIEIVGSKIHNASYVIKGGDTLELADLVNMALEDSGLTAEEWNTLDDQTRYEYIDTTLKELQDGEHGDDEQPVAEIIEQVGEAVNATEQQAELNEDAPKVDLAPTGDTNNDSFTHNLENLTRKELEPLFEAKFKRKPATAMKVDDIRRALSEDDD